MPVIHRRGRLVVLVLSFYLHLDVCERIPTLPLGFCLNLRLG